MFLHIFLLEVYIDNVFVMSSRETYSSYFSFSLLQSFSLTNINTKLIYHQLSLNNYVPLKFSDVHFLPLHLTTRDRIRKYEWKFDVIPRMGENWCIGNIKRILYVPSFVKYKQNIGIIYNKIVKFVYWIIRNSQKRCRKSFCCFSRMCAVCFEGVPIDSFMRDILLSHQRCVGQRKHFIL